MATRYALALHGGAGTIAPCPVDAQRPWHEALREALRAGEAVLERDGTALDAVVETVVRLEECPLFNAGRGAVFNADERHELDAGVMDGATLAAGAVACVRRVRNPVRAAREVLRAGRNVLLVAEGAERFAEACGLEPVEPGWFSTPERLAELRVAQALREQAGGRARAGAPCAAPESGRFGTVGAVALDRAGHLAAATSTGGMTGKPAGRVGDTPIVGAGVYANDATCAVSATGTGEHFVRACAAHEVHARMRFLRADLDDAVASVLATQIEPMGGVGGMIALDRDGRVSLRYTSPGMYRAWAREGSGSATAIFAA